MSHRAKAVRDRRMDPRCDGRGGRARIRWSRGDPTDSGPPSGRNRTHPHNCIRRSRRSTTNAC
ncbi:arsenical-resistance protein [Halanaeroarchaeum sulfurireducens]|uniref:Arsenical-resistance protein n=1 Tax=Halanaeroarchaeum sulfurireducens TaxID=1604004 RepID=A0A0F7P8J2_9EURY|nr:arsenical-resistance protein [Halanaeroarchaeum sulfurireducens]ALG80942.1 arsenical-resistance protein [Halanaeroarchaeum sulfurireducens]